MALIHSRENSPVRAVCAAEETTPFKSDAPTDTMPVLRTKRKMLLRKLYVINRQSYSDSTNAYALQQRMAMLNDTNQQHEQIMNKIYELQPPDIDTDLDEADQFYELYTKLAESAASGSVCEVKTEPNPKPTPSYTLNAPIPTFDGDYLKWPKFKAIFSDIMAQCHQSSAMKLFHLEKALIGKASGVLNEKIINDGNFEQGWKVVCEQYENKRLLVESHLAGLLNVKKMSNDSSQELQRVLNETKNHVDSLEYLNVDHAQAFELLVTYLLTKSIDGSIKKSWEQTMKFGELPSYAKTISFLKEQTQVLERCEETNSSKPITRTQRTHVARILPTIEQMPRTCEICNENHSINFCERFQRLTIHEREKKAKELGLCLNCLAKGHTIKTCNSKYKCRKCYRKHHTLLHREIDNTMTNQLRNNSVENREITQSDCSSRNNSDHL